MKIKSLQFFLTLLFLILCITNSFSQNQFKIDSLKYELAKFDAKKKELGSNSSKMTDTIKVEILNALSSKMRKSNTDSALLYAKSALNLAEQLDYKKGIATAYDLMGIIVLWKGDINLALDYLQKSLKICTAIGYKYGEQICYNDMGTAYSRQGNYPVALAFTIKALETASEIKDNKNVFYCYNNLGIIYKLQQNYEEALKCYFKCLEMPVVKNDTYNLCAVYSNLGALYSVADSLEKAKVFLKKGLKLAYEIDFKQAAISMHNDLGTGYLKQKNYKDALSNYLSALAIAIALDNKDGIGDAYINIGTVYYKEGNSKKAILNIEKGLTIAKQTNQSEQMKNAYKTLASIYETTKNYKLAYLNATLFKQINDSMFNLEKEKKFTQLQLNYSFKSIQDSTKAEQLKKDALTAKEMENQRSIRNYIALVMGLIVLFLIVLIFQRNKIASSKKQQALELERSRISMDLHDDLGAELTGILMMSEQNKASKNELLINDNTDKIITSSRKVVNQMGEIVWAMNSNNDTLESLLNYIHKYAINYADDMQMDMKFLLPDAIAIAKISGVARRNIFLVVKESLNNIVKHSQASAISIDVNSNNNSIAITVADNGQGFEIANTRKEGNGLINMKNRMEAIVGNYNITSVIGQGTKTTISFPLM